MQKITTTEKNRAGLLAITKGQSRNRYLPVNGYEINGEYYSTIAPKAGDVATIFMATRLKDGQKPGASPLYKWSRDCINILLTFVDYEQ